MRLHRSRQASAASALVIAFCAAEAFVSGSLGKVRQVGRICRWSAEELYAQGFSLLESGSDLAKGIRCMQQASEQGFAPADTELGTAYAQGMFGLPQDVEKARYFLERGAEGGDVTAHFNLGVLKVKGKLGFPQDKRAAAKHFRIAGEAGHRNALMNLSRMFATGDGIPQDSQQAAQCVIQAAQKGEDMKDLLEKIRSGTLDPNTTNKLQEEMDRIRERAQQMPGFT
ncbi:unnamed protein product [Durusdinium trenchii]|uniref:Sel1 repeat family protein n=2 Tax=Durusdinium trenchii TaxID=1381693 RepID=A0ABP0SY48_9DINO